MINQKKFGFIIWGVRSGFSNELLYSDKIEEVQRVLRDDETRQLCNPVDENFYSVEQTHNYFLLSIYNPTLRDHVGRKAYIAITIVLEKGYQLNGDVVNILDELMDFYVQPQENSFVPNIIAVEVEAKLALHSVNYTGVEKGLNASIKAGHFPYTEKKDITKYFNLTLIANFEKVYFYKSGLMNFENKPNYVKFEQYKRYVVRLNGDYRRFSFNVNGRPAKAIDNTIEFFSLPGERNTLFVVDNSTKVMRDSPIYNTDFQLDLNQIFPPKIAIETTKSKSWWARNGLNLALIASTLACFIFFGYVFWIEIWPGHKPEQKAPKPPAEAPQTKGGNENNNTTTAGGQTTAKDSIPSTEATKDTRGSDKPKNEKKTGNKTEPENAQVEKATNLRHDKNVTKTKTPNCQDICREIKQKNAEIKKGSDNNEYKKVKKQEIRKLEVIKNQNNCDCSTNK